MSDENRLQFCAGDRDITSDMYAEDDATEVRVWPDDGDGCLIAVAVDQKTGQWEYAASDYGPPSGDTSQQFASWQEALNAFGY